MNQLKEVELKKYRDQADKMFGEGKNQSNMISEESNKIRNDIMRQLKYEQIKKRNLREFIRKSEQDIIKKRRKRLSQIGLPDFTN